MPCSRPQWRSSGVRKRIALCRCSPLYQPTKRSTHCRAAWRRNTRCCVFWYRPGAETTIRPLNNNPVCSGCYKPPLAAKRCAWAGNAGPHISSCTSTPHKRTLQTFEPLRSQCLEHRPGEQFRTHGHGVEINGNQRTASGLYRQGRYRRGVCRRCA